jgi:peptidoglycan hydrolase-like protein with peptidoglycan-binding domain
MKNTYFRAGVMTVGLLFTPLLGSTLFQSPAVAQNQKIIAADGRLTEYSPSSAPVLQRGSTGDVVRDVQQLLRSRGFYFGAIDGIYGPRMASSVITFQRSRNLPATGVIEAKTWESLIDLSQRVETPTSNSLSKYDPNLNVYLKIGSNGQIVRDLQSFLKIAGYYSGTIDGIYGTSTALAVEAFQQRYPNLRNDGIVGPRTWRAMLNPAS